MLAVLARARAPRSALIATAALALTATVATGAQAASSRGNASLSFRPACAAAHQPGIASCFALIRTGGVRPLSGHARGPAGFGYGPADLKSAYKLPASSAVSKVAVVDAFNDPNAVADLAFYRKSWGLSACDTTTKAGCLTVTNQNGAASPLPRNSGTTGWATEESLDVDMVAAICPKCHIFLVEANSPAIANLGTAVNSAVKVLKAKYVSNSYGGAESSTETTWDTLYYQHAGVAVTAAAGDSGAGVSYPAASQYVTSVGGTTLTKAPGTPRGWKESTWSGSGSGCSAFEPEPSWQMAYSTGCTSKRSDNDVAAVADPNTGVAIYDTYDQSGWLEVGGTSVSSPIIASVYALAGTPTAGTYPASYPYADPSELFNLCPASCPYYQPVGLGSPDGTSSFAG